MADARRCPDCGSPVRPWDTYCPHRRACEARQMLAAGASAAEAAAHAQRLSPDRSVGEQR